MTPPPITLAQTIVLLSLSRGEQPPVMPPTTRDKLRRYKLIAPSAPPISPSDGKHTRAPKRPYEITAQGSLALATSRWIEHAQRALERPTQFNRQRP